MLTRNSLLLAAVAATTLASAAKAGFIISSTRIADTQVGFTGDEIVQFFAKNDGTGGQAGTTKLLATDSTFTTPGTGSDTAMVFNFRDQEGLGDPNNDADTANASGFANGLGSFIRVGGTSFSVASQSPNVVDSNGTSDPQTPTNTTTTNYVNNHSFEVAGFNSTSPVATSGAGARFASIVVPIGTPVFVTGSVGAEAGPAVSFTASNGAVATPEPASLGLIAVGALGLIGRRKKA